MPSPGLRKWMQQHVSLALLLALVLSVLLHAVLLSEIDWRVWMPAKDAGEVILQARLVTPPAAVIAQPANASATSTPHRLHRQPLTPSTSAAATDVQAQEAAVDDPAPRLPATEVVAPLPPVDAQAQQAEIEAWHAEDATVDAAVEEPAPPYQHVTTDFDIYVNGESRPAGTATIEYRNQDATRYWLHWQIDGRGLLKLIYPSLEQHSEGDIGLQGLKPRFYRYAFGQRASKTYEATFDWDANVIRLKTSKGEQGLPLPPQTQDILSFMYQFMFVPPLQEMRVNLTNGRRLGEYEYAFEGEDSMVIADRTIQTIHIVHTRGDNDEKTELWLASDYRYVPVKIKKLEKNGMVIEQVATRLIAE